MPDTPSYKSLILTVDHTTAIEGALVQKVVYSDQTLEEAILALLDYYGEADYLKNPETIKLFQQVALSDLPAVVYRTKENIQIVMAMGTHDELLARSESLADCHLFILNTVGEVVANLDKAQGDVSPLTVLSWSFEQGGSAPEFPEDEGTIFPTDPSDPE